MLQQEHISLHGATVAADGSGVSQNIMLFSEVHRFSQREMGLSTY